MQQTLNPIGFQAPLMKSKSKDTKAWLNVSGRQLALLDNDFIIVSMDDGQTWQFFNLAADIVESKDIASEDPQRLDRMKAGLRKWLVSCKNSASGADYGIGR